MNWRQLTGFERHVVGQVEEVGGEREERGECVARGETRAGGDGERQRGLQCGGRCGCGCRCGALELDDVRQRAQVVRLEHVAAERVAREEAEIEVAQDAGRLPVERHQLAARRPILERQQVTRVDASAVRQHTHQLLGAQVEQARERRRAERLRRARRRRMREQRRVRCCVRVRVEHLRVPPVARLHRSLRSLLAAQRLERVGRRLLRARVARRSQHPESTNLVKRTDLTRAICHEQSVDSKGGLMQRSHKRCITVNTQYTRDAEMHTGRIYTGSPAEISQLRNIREELLLLPILNTASIHELSCEFMRAASETNQLPITNTCTSICTLCRVVLVGRRVSQCTHAHTEILSLRDWTIDLERRLVGSLASGSL